MNTGYEKLVASVKRDCDKESSGNCFNPNGCDKERSKCFHRFCNTFKWVIDRAKHYAEKTGLKWEEILNAWEEHRDYWYMNYYQDCNQPLLEGSKVRVFDTIEDAVQSVGNKFRCPACGGVSTDPYQCNSGLKIHDIKMSEKGKGKKIICNWKIYGFLGGLGKDVYIFCKDKARGQKISMPLAWEPQKESVEGALTKCQTTKKQPKTQKN